MHLAPNPTLRTALSRRASSLPATVATLAFAALSAQGMLACGAPDTDSPVWQPVSSASAPQNDEPSVAGTTSLGDPFVLVARTLDSSPLHTPTSGDMPPPSAHALSAWVMLHSDACEVDLESLHVAFLRSEQEKAAWLGTVGPAHGIVLDSSAQHAVVRYDTHIQVQRDAAWSAGESRPATIEVRAHQDGDHVWLHTHVTAEAVDSEPPLRLAFVVRGAFEQDPEAIPDRRLDCPRW